MTETGLIALIVYATIALPCWYVLAGHIAWSGVRIGDTTNTRRPFKGNDLAAGIALGFICAVIWPVSMLILFLVTLNSIDGHRAMRIAERRLYTPQGQRQALTAERARAIERESARLERATGMHGSVSGYIEAGDDDGW